MCPILDLHSRYNAIRYWNNGRAHDYIQDYLYVPVFVVYFDISSKFHILIFFLCQCFPLYTYTERFFKGDPIVETGPHF